MTDEITTLINNELLAGGRFRLRLVEIRLLILAIAHNERLAGHRDSFFIVYPRDFETLFNLNPSSAHRQMRDAAEGLCRSKVVINDSHSLTDNPAFKTLNWFSHLLYLNHSQRSVLLIKFDSSVLPYLSVNVPDSSRIALSCLDKLDTPFSLRLYLWLMKRREKCDENQAEYVIQLSLFWMKDRAGLAGKYKDYRDFRQKVLEPAVSRINLYTNLNIDWMPVSEKRVVRSIDFTVTDKNSLSQLIAIRSSQRCMPEFPALTVEMKRRTDDCFKIMLACQGIKSGRFKLISSADLIRMEERCCILNDLMNNGDKNTGSSAKAVNRA